MEKSRHNIFSKIEGSDTYFLINVLHGQADILDPETAARYQAGDLTDEAFIEKGYVVDPAAEKALFNRKYLDFLEARDNDEVQIFFVPWYACNFNCSYCYQGEYSVDSGTISDEMLDAFFSYVGRTFSGRRKYITLFGGEPLLPGKAARRFLERFFTLAGEYAVDVALVTNGYHLIDHIDLFSRCTIREVQVTLDGVGEVHNRRRPLKNGNENTFQRISDGIDRLIEQQYNVNLRVVLDRENVEQLPSLAAYAAERGWTDYQGFKTQLGRNYELHSCQASPENLFSRTALYERLYELSESHPELLAFHKPAYSLAKFLKENGELPDPLYDACPACKTEWAFDYSGKIYPCTATVGKTGEEVGTYYPKISLDTEKVEAWESRDITTIAKCRTCEMSLACGGGCGSVAANQSGSIHAPDCNPVTRLLELGISHYFEKE